MDKLKTAAVLLFAVTGAFVFAQNNMQQIHNVKVVDGDTIKVDGQYIRLVDIDCFETYYNPRAEFQHELYNLPYSEIYQKGQNAKMFLTQIVECNKDSLYVENLGKDKYERTLGKLYVNQKININRILLDSGICPKYFPRPIS